MSQTSVPLCTQAACLVAKYDIHQGSRRPLLVPDSVIVDPQNRDGLFPTAVDIHCLGEAILGCGFNVAMTRGVCVQLPPSGPAHNAIVEYNEKKVGVDAELFPKTKAEHVMFSGVGGNTLNLFLRCVVQGRKASPDKLRSICSGEHLSIEALRVVDPAFAAAATEGVPYIILSNRLRTEEPKAIAIIQAAENMLGSIQRLDSEVALIRRVCSMVSDWDMATLGVHGLQNMLAKQAPHLTDHIEGITAFALKLGGDNVHIKWLSDLHERFVGGSRKIKGQFFYDLANALPVDLPRVKRSVLFLQYTCPPEAVRDKYCEWISCSELRGVVKKEGWKELADVCEKRMAAMEAEYSDKLNYKDFQTVFARFESRTAAFLFKRPKRAGAAGSSSFWESIDEICAELAADMKTYNKEISLPPPLTSSSPSPVVLMDPSGRVIDQSALLKERGIQVGMWVKTLTSGEPIYKVIKECSVQGITLSTPGTEGFTTISLDEFKKWTAVMDAGEVQDRGALLAWSQTSGIHNVNHKAEVAKSLVAVALDHVAGRLAAAETPDIRVYTKPKQMVIAGELLLEHKLALAPLSHKMVARKGEKPNNAIEIAVGDCVVCLLPHFVPAKDGVQGSGFTEPFWAVRRVGPEEKATANCHLHTVQVTSCQVSSTSEWLPKKALKSTVGIPILVNSREIKKGEELVLLDETILPKKRKEAPVFHKPSKQPRT
jgi:hypothetical protein